MEIHDAAVPADRDGCGVSVPEPGVLKATPSIRASISVTPSQSCVMSAYVQDLQLTSTERQTKPVEGMRETSLMSSAFVAYGHGAVTADMWPSNDGPLVPVNTRRPIQAKRITRLSEESDTF
jgi:hypothetical protein